MYLPLDGNLETGCRTFLDHHVTIQLFQFFVVLNTELLPNIVFNELILPQERQRAVMTWTLRAFPAFAIQKPGADWYIRLILVNVAWS